VWLLSAVKFCRTNVKEGAPEKVQNFWAKHNAPVHRLKTRTIITPWNISSYNRYHTIWAKNVNSWTVFPLKKFYTEQMFVLLQNDHQLNTIYCKMMEHERWAKYFPIFSNIECFSELTKIAQFYFSVMAHYANVERFFPWWSHKLKRKINRLIESVSTLLKLVCNSKHLSCS